MTNIKQNLAIVHQNIIAAAQKYGRDPNSIKLIAVSKTRNIEEIQIATECGQKDFG